MSGPAALQIKTHLKGEAVAFRGLFVGRLRSRPPPGPLKIKDWRSFMKKFACHPSAKRFAILCLF